MMESAKDFLDTILGLQHQCIYSEPKIIDAILSRDTAIRAECADSWEKYARNLWGTKRTMTVEEFVAEGRAAIMGGG